MTRRWPDDLATRFTLLLVGALVVGNAIAALLMAREGSDYDRAVRLEGDMGRLVALVTALEATDHETGMAIVRNSSTGFTRFSIDVQQVVAPDTVPVPELQAEIARALPGREVHVSDARNVPTDEPQPLLTLLSVRLTTGAHTGEWLNALIYPLPQITAWQWKRGFFAPLAVSLLGTIVVGLLFIRKMTRPLRDLARAARAAGRGDRSARVPEAGARELREAAVAFNDMQARIADFDAERMRVVAALGHDLRLPITSLRIRAELLDDAETQDAMVRTLDQMTVMADDLRIYSHDGPPAEPLCDTDLAAMLGCLCRERAVPFMAAGPVVVPIHPVALTRAVGNLIDNALRYAGSARVRLERHPDGAAVIVEDDGPGIPPDLLDRVCEPFVRGEQSRCPDTGGSGLGLAIARGAAAAHGGTLVLTNRPEGGLRAALYLPMAPVAPPAPSS